MWGCSGCRSSTSKTTPVTRWVGQLRRCLGGHQTRSGFGHQPWLQSGPGRRPRRRRAHLPVGPSRRTPPSTPRVWPDLDPRMTVDFFEGKSAANLRRWTARRSGCLAQGGAGRRPEPDRPVVAPYLPRPAGGRSAPRHEGGQPDARPDGRGVKSGTFAHSGRKSLSLFRRAGSSC
jgi:hypothetical protein